MAKDKPVDRRHVTVPGEPSKRYDEDVLGLVLSEVQRARQTVGTILDGMKQRAALLAGTSSIAGAISVDPNSGWSWMPVGLFAVAALAGLAVFWPTSGDTVKVDALLDRTANYEAPQVQFMFIRATTTETLALRQAVKRQALISRIGLSALGLGVLASIALALL